MGYRRHTWLAVNIVEAAVYVPELSLDNILEDNQLWAEESGRVQSKCFPWNLPQEELYSIREIRKS
jgi:hypothetical protein